MQAQQKLWLQSVLTGVLQELQIGQVNSSFFISRTDEVIVALIQCLSVLTPHASARIHPRRGGEGECLCTAWREKLQIFCKKDMMAICWLDERSQEHLGHQTALIEEVNHEYKRELQEALQVLMGNEKRCHEQQDGLQQQRADWENQIQSKTENVQIEYNGLRGLLDSKENEEMQELMKEKENVMKELEASENELGKQRELLRDLTSDVEHQLELSTMETLQGVNYVLTRSQTLRLKEPPNHPPQKRTFQVPDLKGMLQAYHRHLVILGSYEKNHAVIVINR